MLLNTLCFILLNVGVSYASPYYEGELSSVEPVNFFRDGRQGIPGERSNGQCTTTSAVPRPPPPPEQRSDCAVSYEDVTTTVVVTQVVEVSQGSMVYTTQCPTSAIVTTDGGVTTSYFTTVSTITSTYLTTVTVTATSGESDPEQPPQPTGYPQPPAEQPSTSVEATKSYGTVPPYLSGGWNSTSSDVASTGFPTGVYSSRSSSMASSIPVSSSAPAPSSPVPSGSSSSSTSSEPPSASAAACPAVWRTIAQQMIGAFTGCNEPSRASIRFAFHDAAGYSSKTTPYGPASGGADGSILFSDEEVNRVGNAPLPAARAIFQNFYANFDDQVSGADFVQFAAAIGVRMCGGPVYKTVVGREDDARPCPEFMMPAAFGVNASFEALTSLWADKGIDERELAALIGAHSVSRAFAQQANGIPSNSPQDSTPASFDTKYYSETQANNAPSGVYRFDSDINLSNATTVIGQAFKDFAVDTDLWRIEYSAAAYKLSVMGLSSAKLASLTDCTSVIEELT